MQNIVVWPDLDGYIKIVLCRNTTNFLLVSLIYFTFLDLYSSLYMNVVAAYLALLAYLPAIFSH